MKMIVFQLFLFCLLFTALVKFAVRGGAINGLYFYPKPVQERAIAIGLTDRETMDRRLERCKGLQDGLPAGTSLSGGHELV